jgi:PAS domain S-box-containing protein
LAALSVAAALAVRWLLDPVLQTYAPYLPFTLAVMVAGRFAGRGPALAATAGGVLCSWYFLLEPRFSFAATPAQLASLALFAVVGAGISLLTGQLHQALDASRRGEQRFRTLFENAAEGIYIAGPDGRFLAVNTRGLELCGYSREELLGLHISDLVTPQDRSRLAAVTAQIKGGQPSLAEWLFVRKDASAFPGGVSARLLPDGNLLVSLRDLTERRRLEEQVRQSQKLEGIGRLAGGVAHDFNNLLTVISGYARMGLEDLPADHELRESLAEIDKAAERAAALTRQLLAFSRNHLFEARTLVVDEVVRDFEKMLRRIIGEDIDLTLALDAKEAAIRTEAGRIEQVVLNLAVNARDAMPEGGKLVIETARFDADEEFAAAHPDVKPGPHVTLAVSDTGTGMSPEVKAHVFEPFFTTKEAGKGTGLGLSTVYGIVKQSGGSIWIESQPGRGSTFYLAFPTAEITGEAAQAEIQRPEFSGTETILLVEDEMGLRKYLRQALERHGYTVIETANGREALDQARKNERRIHLLLTDMVMPEMGGTELAAHFGHGPHAIPILCMSGYTDRAWRPDCSTASFIQKPFTREALLGRIRQLLAQQAPLSRAAAVPEARSE